MKILLWSLLGLVVVIAAGAGSFVAFRAHKQTEFRAERVISTPNGIQEGLFVKLGGIEQWISIRGEDRNNPVILVMHGGPATSYMSFTPMFQPWEKHFTVVQWDRRGVGKTFGRNGAKGSGEMTLTRIAADGGELATFLAEHLHQKKIILLGHSMGSMIGLTMAARYPEKFYAYVGTEQIIDMARNEEVSYQIILDRLRTQGNAQAVAKLEKVGPPPYANPMDWGVKQQLAEVADESYGRISKEAQEMLMYAPEYTLKDAFDFVGGAQFSISRLYPQWMAFEGSKLTSKYDLPVIIIQGEDDVMTPTSLVEAWLGTIEAPRKEMRKIEGGGHLVFATARDAYLDALLTLVRPLAVPAVPVAAVQTARP